MFYLLNIRCTVAELIYVFLRDFVCAYRTQNYRDRDETVNRTI